jgi:hypothetical protein
LLKKQITYTNPFTDKEVTEEHYFHISKADLVEMELEEHKAEYINAEGKKLTGMEAKLQQIVESEDGRAIMIEFKDIIRRAYGKKEGDRFVRSPEIWAEFASSEAYSQLIFELLTQATSAAEFINGIVPGNLEQIASEVRTQAAKEEIAETNGGSTAASATPAPSPKIPFESSERSQELSAATSENPVTLTKQDIVEMDDADLRSGLAEGRYKLS